MSHFLDYFKPIEKGNFGLTEVAVYASLQAGKPFIPVYGGNKDHLESNRKVSIKGKTVNGDSIHVFSGEGVIISLDGSAGSMTYKNNEKFALNHHAGFFQHKEGFKQKVNLEFFALFLREKFKSISVSEGSKTLTKDQIYNTELILPTFETQQSIMFHIKKLVALRRKYSRMLLSLNGISHKKLIYPYQSFQARDVPISDLLVCMSGNTGLTEETVYRTLQLAGKRYAILSGSTSINSSLGFVPSFRINNNPIKLFEGKEGIHVARKGKAGRITYLQPDRYTINDNAYILSLKSNVKYKISLKWLASQHRTEFLEYTSRSSNGTWNKTGFFEEVRIDVPQYAEQLEIVSIYTRLELLEEHLTNMVNKISNLFLKDVVS